MSFAGKAAVSYVSALGRDRRTGRARDADRKLQWTRGIDYQVNSAFELVIGEGAHVDHIKIGFDGDAALRVSTLGVVGRREGALQRLRLHARRRGGAQPDFRALRWRGDRGLDSAVRRSSRASSMSIIRLSSITLPAVAPAESSSTVLDERKSRHFPGQDHRRAARAENRCQDDDARALLLSDEAEADNKPELEIFADDVQCGHGATAGALDAGSNSI